MFAHLLLVITTALLCTSCQTESPRTTPDNVTTAASQGQTAPQAAAPPAASVATPASAAPAPEPAPAASAAAEPAEPNCFTAAQSMEYAKPHKSADPPYTDCAAGVFSHCSGGDGERGHYCSIAFNVKATALARKTKPNSCCYGAD